MELEKIDSAIIMGITTMAMAMAMAMAMVMAMQRVMDSILTKRLLNMKLLIFLFANLFFLNYLFKC